MKHCIPPMHGKTGFPFPFTRIHRFSANEKDFSLALEMTIRGSGILTSLPTPRGKALMRRHRSPSFLWKEVPRKGGGWIMERNKKECVRSFFSYRCPGAAEKALSVAMDRSKSFCLSEGEKRALPSGNALFSPSVPIKSTRSNAQDRSFWHIPPSLDPYTSSASSRMRARLFSQPRQGSVMDLP